MGPETPSVEPSVRRRIISKRPISGDDAPGSPSKAAKHVKFIGNLLVNDTDAELEELYHAGLAACDAQRQRTGREPPPGGKDRFSVSDPLAFDSHVVLACEELLLRVL